MLKLTVAANVQEARKALERQLSETMSLAESLNHSQFLNQGTPRMSLASNTSAIRRGEDFSPFGDIMSMPDTDRRDFKKISHEMGVGNDAVVTGA